ncbi:hypothetical protein [Marinoscillum pacificum]|uniref:hypothetical protein n=1 Tax=Marinoscillum pacificum TaxID=392723 RepID=UPI0021583A83|nr:hypothetical protein [Marinoscillum pacificum]
MKNLILAASLILVMGSCVLKSDYDALKSQADSLTTALKNNKDAFGLEAPTEDQITLKAKAEELLKKKPDVSRGQGSRISRVVAERHINDFKSIRKSLDPCLTSIDLVMSSSYSFGLDEIKSLIDDIEKLNRTFSGTYSGDKELTGIRVHMGKSMINVPNPEGDSSTVFYIDAFITPVDKKGRHIFTDGAIAYSNIPDPNSTRSNTLSSPGSGSLNESNPCPDVCP